MTTKLILGPLLGVESDSSYTVCFVTDKSAANATVTANGTSVQADLIEEIHSGLFWRAVLAIIPGAASQGIDYQVVVDGEAAIGQDKQAQWTFHVPRQHVPGSHEKPKMAYASCNGFSDPNLMNSTDQPYALWTEMKKQHQYEPFSLLILGGDQVYADSIWSKVKALEAWNALDREDKVKRKATKVMKEQIDRFYSELYCDRWSTPAVATMLATIPSIMMWDDHDIFDGWGSYPEDLQTCDVYPEIYKAAVRHFRWFQLRSTRNVTLLAGGGTPSHYSFGFTYRGYTILALDNRAQRSLTQVMSDDQWTDVLRFLDGHKDSQDLLVLSAVPVVYRDFSFSEAAVDATPWEEELTDDLKDHWRAKEHEGERAKLIMRLLQNAGQRKARTVILSGDVHVGCLGVIQDSRGPESVSIHQVVSSGIVASAAHLHSMVGCAGRDERSHGVSQRGSNRQD